MTDNRADINDLVLFLAALATKPLTDNEVWQCFGYKKRPKHGSMWNIFIPKFFELEDFIIKELLTMGFIDILNGIKKTAETIDMKLLISIGVADKFLSATKHMFPINVFMDNLFLAHSSYLKSEKGKIHEPSILKAKGTLNSKNFARFMVGTIQLIALNNSDDFLLKSDYLKGVIEKSSKEGTLKISMPVELCEKYVSLISKNIFEC